MAARTGNIRLSDARIRTHFQFWFFTYDTGNPIAYSAARLRDALRDAIAKIDPGGKNPALRNVFVIGHSQGSLLAKLLVVDPATTLWDAVSRQPLDQLDLSAETRGLLRRSLYFNHRPFVSRVVFIATPQRGSYIAGSSLPHLIARVVRTPQSVISATTDLLTNSPDAFRFDPTKPASEPASVA
jgi:hypothetical protein